ncbi:SDR family NAD(P)-dependent oxidoreductase [Cellulomonas marina]|uniref:Cyclic-di-GMP-binding biofilm dispersal mediator protein n=1 Tax=Cellulomonas marina TaxID=988821 RepID=A0A1I0VAM1_9CELL|nr:SDR family NAD(P)-dependent oxidoreductase [Cellulomonas marina]GIG29183.1 hypothetical protein Cma02nite_17830 [Cellulomonas marina]SFA73308.1 cyclic-di-GMP-binding biofilm dispersal mediator protein [Cellulomonas marina]
MTQLQGASVLVVGASGGLGAPLAAALAGAGADLTLVARDEGRLRAAAPADAHVVALDVTAPGAPTAAVDAAVQRWGRLDGVVVAAGVVAFGPAEAVEEEVLRALLAVNTVAPVLLLAAASPHLLAAAEAGRDPFVLHVSAVTAEAPTAGMAAYSASKAALTAFDSAAGRELRKRRVRVVDARPPHTETGLAGRPIAGQAPHLQPGKDPAGVAARLVRALVEGERDLPAAAFDEVPTAG